MNSEIFRQNFPRFQRGSRLCHNTLKVQGKEIFPLAGRESPLSSLVGLDWEDPEDIRARVRVLEQVMVLGLCDVLYARLSRSSSGFESAAQDFRQNPSSQPSLYR